MNVAKRIRLLVYSTLYPNDQMPHHGIFVQQRLRMLLTQPEVSARVLAPVPWFPFKRGPFRWYSRFAKVSRQSSAYGINACHCRFLVIPKIGMMVSPVLLALATWGKVRRYVRNGDVDVIDAHYFYPDGVAAVILGKLFKKPVVITARGTDINLIPNYRIPRAWMRWAMKRCRMMITVSEALRSRLIEIGADPMKVRTLRNGVDLERFVSMPERDKLRAALGIEGFTLLSVGHLIERKGHNLVIEALASMVDVRLIVAGEGPMDQALRTLAEEKGVADRIFFAGLLDQPNLIRFYNAADSLVLASSREGMANVLLESIACGTPVVATPFWGAPEVITSPDAGRLMKDRSIESIRIAVEDLRRSYPDRSATRRHGEKFGWEPTTDGQIDVFRQIMAGQK